VGLDANQAEQQMATLKKGIESGLTGPLEQFFDSGIEHARNMQQAFAGLADSIVSSIQKMVTHMLIQIATQKLMAAFHKTSEVAGGAPKIAEAQAAGTAQALPLQAAALALKTSGIAVSASGTGIVTGATALGVSSSGLMTAAAALSLAAIQFRGGGDQEEMASAASGGMAGGGQVPGRGSSDSVHAMLTPGEFVLRTAAVRAIGGDRAACDEPGVEHFGADHDGGSGALRGGRPGGGNRRGIQPGARPHADRFGGRAGGEAHGLARGR